MAHHRAFSWARYFSHCIVTLAKVTMFLGTQNRQYADGTSLYIFASKEELTVEIKTIKRCMNNLFTWLLHNDLALNPSV